VELILRGEPFQKEVQWEAHPHLLVCLIELKNPRQLRINKREQRQKALKLKNRELTPL